MYFECMKSRRINFYLVLLACLLVLYFRIAQSQAQQVSTNFRVFPYLQLNEQGNYVLTWFGNSQINSEIQLSINGEMFFEQQSVTGEIISELTYVPFELNQQINGLLTGSWLISGQPVRYRIVLPSIPASSIVNYRVKLDGELFQQSFSTIPSKNEWNHIRFIALADSETEPRGRVLRREWDPGIIGQGSRPAVSSSLWSDKFGSVSVSGREVLRYPLTEKVGYEENLKIINSRAPNFMLLPGDLVQGGGYQPGWDEFFNHNAGVFAQGLSSYPILPALGNWENFGGSNGGYGITQEGRFAPKVGRDKFFSYFIMGGLTIDNRRMPFYRVDYGPLTILTLDSSKGVPDDSRSNYPLGNKISGQEFLFPGTDTQENFTISQYNSFGGNDIFPMNEGFEQWNWVIIELEKAQKAGQLIFVQFHHSPFSSGEHGFPMNHTLSTGQGGTPMRVYHSLFEKYGVIAVFSGHSELFERSFVDLNGDGIGVHYYDVGVAGDGLRGERKAGDDSDLKLVKYNPFQRWSADQFEAEIWQTIEGVPQLTHGGKHYGHLEVNVNKVVKTDGIYAQIQFLPVHAFPTLNSSYELIHTERRVYTDVVTLELKLEESSESMPALPVFKNEIDIFLDATGVVNLEKEMLVENWNSSFELFEFSISQIDFGCMHVGRNEVEVKVFWQGDEQLKQQVILNVRDNFSPELIIRNLTIDFDITQGVFSLTPMDFVKSVNDNCELGDWQSRLSISQPVIDCSFFDGNSERAVLDVLVGMSDVSGNRIEQTATVTVNKREPSRIRILGTSTIIQSSNTVLTLSQEFAYETVDWLRDGVSLGLSVPRLEVTQAGLYVARLRLPSGCEVETESFIVEIVEPKFPEVKNEVSIFLNEVGVAHLQLSDVLKNNSEVNPSFEFLLSKENFGCDNLGENEVKLTSNFKDKGIWSFTIKVTIQDTISPSFNLKELRIQLNPFQQLKSIVFEDLADSFSDNCAIERVSLSHETITCQDIGVKEIDVIAIDKAGNQTVKTVFVLVEWEKVEVNLIAEEELFCKQTRLMVDLPQIPFEGIRWFKDGVLIPGVEGQLMEVSESGSYQAEILFLETCDSVLTEIYTIEKIELLGELTMDENILKAPTGNFSYRWFKDDALVQEGDSNTLPLVGLGTYYVRITRRQTPFCEWELGPLAVTVLGIPTLQMVDSDFFSVFPNPFIDKIQVNVKSELIRLSVLKMRDSSGKEFPIKVRQFNESVFLIEIERLAKGMYWLVIQDEKGNQWMKRLIH